LKFFDEKQKVFQIEIFLTRRKTSDDSIISTIQNCDAKEISLLDLEKIQHFYMKKNKEKSHTSTNPQYILDEDLVSYFIITLVTMYLIFYFYRYVK